MDNGNNRGDINIKVKENENENDNNNYLKDTFLKNKTMNILILLLSLIAFICEFIYRESLFKSSLEIEDYLQKSSWNFTIYIFKIITKVGGEYLMVVPVGFILIFFSLIKSSVFMTGFLFCLQFHSMMKIWYGNTRPFWENKDLYKGICDGGFGNPSGHSMISTYLYLTLYIYLQDLKCFKNNTNVNIVSLVLIIFWILLIIYSRIILGLHSLNQIIYGTTLGLTVFSLEIVVFKLNEMPATFYKKLFKEKTYIISISSCIIFVSFLSIINKFIFNSSFDIEKYNKVINEKCGEKYPLYRRFNNDGVFGSFCIFIFMGMYFGQILFWYLIDNKYKKGNYSIEKQIISLNESLSEEDENVKFQKQKENQENLKKSQKIDELIINWNQDGLISVSLTIILKIILVLILCASPILLFILVPKDANLFSIFVCKLAIPFFSSLFLIYSFGFYYIIKFLLGPEDYLLQRLNQAEAKLMI